MALDADILSDSSHNYTLELQGVSSNVTCAYEAQSPIKYYASIPGLWQYNGTCPPGQDFLPPSSYFVMQSNRTFVWWACQTAQSGISYTVYLRGAKDFRDVIGNISCTIFPIQPAVFSVNYTGQLGAFSILEQISVSPDTSTDLVSSAVIGLGIAILAAQGGANVNLIVDSILKFGAGSLGLSPSSQNEKYLRIFEALIQGILDYEVRSICCLSLLFPYAVD
jgi:hypothetical protein